MIELDGTATKARLGANAILGVSLAVAHAAAAEAELPLYRWIGGTNAHVLPVPLMNVINGGAHAQNSLDFQEFMLVPGGRGVLLRSPPHRRRDLPRAQGASEGAGPLDGVGDEGGFAPDLGSAYDACEAILEAAERAGHRERGRDRARSRDERALPRRRLRARAAGRHARRQRHDRPLGRPRRPVPDRLDRGRARRERLGDLADAHRPPRRPVQLVGDDLFVTNVDFLARGIEEKVAQRDPRQGEPDRLAHRDARRDRARAADGYATVISHRSGETEDATIADIAVADEQRADQDGRAGARRSHGQVQPAAPHRGSARRARRLSAAGAPFRGSRRPPERCTYAGRRSSPRSGRPPPPRRDQRAHRGRHGRRPDSTCPTAPTTTTGRGRHSCARPRPPPAGRSR